MNSFVVAFIVAFVASAHAGFLHAPVAAPVVYHAPTLLATPLVSYQYPTYAVHSPYISPVVKTLASPVYAAPVFSHAKYVAYAAPAYGYGHAHAHFHK